MNYLTVFVALAIGFVIGLGTMEWLRTLLFERVMM